MPEPDLRQLDLVAVTSHEMRAPLAAIRGFVDVLRRRGDELTEEEVAEFLGVISVQTDRLIRLTEDLLTMTSLDADNVALEPETIVLIPTLETLARDLPGGERVVIRVAEDAPPRLVADPLRLGQALTNLLTNALKYSAEDRPVVLAVEPAAGDRVRFSVIDDGVGIAPDELGRVFELFYRTKEGARTAEGSGLGLSVTREMVGAMGGEVTAESTRGGGSTFSITLPVEARPAPVPPSATA
jgi:two-component system, NarL family, sensor histidine kinase BarA